MPRFFRPFAKAVLTAALINACVCGTVGAEAQVKDAPHVPKDVFEWVQSTSRADYYFNKDQICYRLNKDGSIDLNILIVPTLKTYDEIQKQDVRTKREWKSLPLAEYDRLVGAAEYLRFDLTKKTVTVYAREDLDETWTALERVEEPDTRKLSDYSERDVEGIFFRSILDYAAKHKDEVLAHTERKGGKLKPEDQKRWDKEKKEREKAEKKKQKELAKQTKHEDTDE